MPTFCSLDTCISTTQYLFTSRVDFPCLFYFLVSITCKYRDENGERKKQLKILDEAAREAKPTERGRVWEGDAPYQIIENTKTHDC